MLWAAGIAGAVILPGLFFLALWGARKLWRLPGGRLAMALMALSATALLRSAATAPLYDTDELGYFESSVAALFNGFDLIYYPHPGLFFNLSTAAYGAVVLVYALVTKTTLLASARHLVVASPFVLLFVSRILSVLSFGAALGFLYALTSQLTRSRWIALGVVAMVLSMPTDLVPTFTPYMLALALMCCFAWLCLRDEELSDKEIVGIGIVAGLSVASHYLAVLALPLISARLIGTSARRVAGLVLLFGVGVGVGFAIGNFQIVTRWDLFLHQWSYRLSEIGVQDVASPKPYPGGTPDDYFYYLRATDRLLPLWWMVPGAVVWGVTGGRSARVVSATILTMLLVLSFAATKRGAYSTFLLALFCVAGVAWLAIRDAGRLKMIAIASLALLIGREVLSDGLLETLKTLGVPLVLVAIVLVTGRPVRLQAIHWRSLVAVLIAAGSLGTVGGAFRSALASRADSLLAINPARIPLQALSGSNGPARILSPPLGIFRESLIRYVTVPDLKTELQQELSDQTGGAMTCCSDSSDLSGIARGTQVVLFRFAGSAGAEGATEGLRRMTTVEAGGAEAAIYLKE